MNTTEIESTTDDIERQLVTRLESLPPDCRERVLEHRGKLPLQALLQLAECLSPRERLPWWKRVAQARWLRRLRM